MEGFLYQKAGFNHQTFRSVPKKMEGFLSLIFGYFGGGGGGIVFPYISRIHTAKI